MGRASKQKLKHLKQQNRHQVKELLGPKHYILYSFARPLPEKPTYVCRICQNKGEPTEASYMYITMGTGLTLNQTHALKEQLSPEDFTDMYIQAQERGTYIPLATYALCVPCLITSLTAFTNDTPKTATLVEEANAVHDTILVAQNHLTDVLRIGRTQATTILEIVKQLEATDGILPLQA